MGDVANVGEVEDVGAVTDLDVGLAAVIGFEEAGEGLDIALAEDAGRADGGGEKLGGLLAVGLENEFLGSGLRWGS